MLVDLTDLNMIPARDPLRSLIYTAADCAVRDVYVDGRKVVDNKTVTGLDRADAAGRLAQAQARMEAAVPSIDYAGRDATGVYYSASLSLGWAHVLAGADDTLPAATTYRRRRCAASAIALNSDTSQYHLAQQRALRNGGSKR